jgi:hypothetical protein
MAKQSRAQKATVGRVMHEFKHGELAANGRKVRNPRQAIAIGLSEAGATTRKPPAQNRKSLGRTKRRERQGETEAASGERGPTRAELYREASRRNLAGRSRMSKAELQRALHR